MCIPRRESIGHRTFTWNPREVARRIGDQETTPSLWQNHHMSAADAREALRIVEAHQLRFLAEWRRLHG
jgi:hypothetical protein